jgi:outer membrane protein assembly factor BamB
MRNFLLLSLLIFVFPGTILICNSQDVIQFRGKNATGVFESTNLLKSWTDDGPPLIWECVGIGNGYGSPIIFGNRIFVNGEIDTISYLFALNVKGEILWKKPIGREWVQSYPGARSTPSIVDNLVYVSAGMGDVKCFNAENGNLIWELNLMEDFGGRLTRFGYSESIIPYKDMVFAMPGGEEHNVVALSRFTGKMIWTSKGVGEIPSYCTPLILELESRTIYISFSERHLLGIDAKSGELLWTHEQDGEGDVHVNTPLYDNGHIYYVAGNGNCGVKLKLSDDGSEISEVWKNKSFDNLMGSFVKIDDFLYASGDNRRIWYSINTQSGEIVDSLRFDKGVTIMADEKLYLYSERGKVTLVDVDNGMFNKISEFRVSHGSKAHFSHPIISNGILYLRRGESLMAYDLRNKI